MNKEEKINTNNIKLVLQYAWKSKKAFLLMVIFMSVGTVFNTIIPRIYGIALNGIDPDPITNPNPISRQNFILILLGAIGLSIIGTVFMGMGRYFSAEVGTMAQYFVRRDIYSAINRQTYSFFNEHETGDLVSRSTSDIETMSPVFNMGITASFQGLLSMFGVTIGVFFFQPQWAWIYLVGIGGYFFIMSIGIKKIRPPYVHSRETFGDLTTVFRENIIGANVVRIFNSQNIEQNKFKSHNKRFKDLTIQAIKWGTILRYSGWILLALLFVLNLIYGGLSVLNGELLIGDFVALLSYVGMIGMPIGMVNRVIMNFIQADAAMARVRDVLESMPEIKESVNPISATNLKGEIDFKNVEFGYTSSLVLKNITFHVDAGSTIAMLGTTGSGKSTLISLLPRFYDAANGEILIDQVNIKEYKIEDLRKQIGFCSQDIFLFNKSIADNIRYGRESASMEEVIQAAKDANIHEFITALDEGYETLVGERGTSLSGGQKQRVAIARALIMEPTILILDDSTSSVDMETEYKIQQALERVMKGRTTFIITQRISTIRNANKIMVMDQGRIVGFDSHENLINQNPLYTQIFETLYTKQKKMTPIIQESKINTEEKQ